MCPKGLLQSRFCFEVLAGLQCFDSLLNSRQVAEQETVLDSAYLG